MLVGHSGDPGRFATRQHNAAYTGTTPIEFSSGGRITHRLSRRANRRLNHALHIVAVTQILAMRANQMAHAAATRITRPSPR